MRREVLDGGLESRRRRLTGGGEMSLDIIVGEICNREDQQVCHEQ